MIWGYHYFWKHPYSISGIVDLFGDDSMIIHLSSSIFPVPKSLPKPNPFLLQKFGAAHTEYLYPFCLPPLKLYLFDTCFAHTLPLCSMIRALIALQHSDFPTRTMPSWEHIFQPAVWYDVYPVQDTQGQRNSQHGIFSHSTHNQEANAPAQMGRPSQN